MRKNTRNFFGHCQTNAYEPLEVDVENNNASSTEGLPMHVFVEVKEQSTKPDLCHIPNTLGCTGLQNVAEQDNLNEDNTTPTTPLLHMLNLHIPGRINCWEASCDLDWTVAEAKKRLFPKESETMRIRMICQGKLLADDGLLGDSVESDGHLHISITERISPDEEVYDDAEEARENSDILLQEFLLSTAIANQETVLNEENQEEMGLGTNVEFVLFATLGIFLGYIMFIFLFLYGITQKKILGIFVGISIHMMLSFYGINIYSML